MHKLRSSIVLCSLIIFEYGDVREGNSFCRRKVLFYVEDRGRNVEINFLV